jgi:hypothetical protein
MVSVLTTDLLTINVAASTADGPPNPTNAAGVYSATDFDGSLSGNALVIPEQNTLPLTPNKEGGVFHFHFSIPVTLTSVGLVNITTAESTNGFYLISKIGAYELSAIGGTGLTVKDQFRTLDVTSFQIHLLGQASAVQQICFIPSASS